MLKHRWWVPPVAVRAAFREHHEDQEFNQIPEKAPSGQSRCPPSWAPLRDQQDDQALQGSPGLDFTFTKVDARRG
jgi:hypothetical protein